eukprot:scaffold7473_cov118-Skeletonema_menzelii.AAC.4
MAINYYDEIAEFAAKNPDAIAANMALLMQGGGEDNAPPLPPLEEYSSNGSLTNPFGLGFSTTNESTSMATVRQNVAIGSLTNPFGLGFSTTNESTSMATAVGSLTNPFGLGFSTTNESTSMATVRHNVAVGSLTNPFGLGFSTTNEGTSTSKNFSVGYRGKPMKDERAKRISETIIENFNDRVTEVNTQVTVFQRYASEHINAGSESALFWAQYTDDDAVSSVKIDGVPLFQFKKLGSKCILTKRLNDVLHFDAFKKSKLQFGIVGKTDLHYIQSMVKGRSLYRIFDPSKDPLISLMAYLEKSEVGVKIVITFNSTDSAVLNTKEHDGMRVFHFRRGQTKNSAIVKQFTTYKDYKLKTLGKVSMPGVLPKNNNVYEKVLADNKNKRKRDEGTGEGEGGEPKDDRIKRVAV